MSLGMQIVDHAINMVVAFVQISHSRPVDIIVTKGPFDFDRIKYLANTLNFRVACLFKSAEFLPEMQVAMIYSGQYEW